MNEITIKASENQPDIYANITLEEFKKNTEKIKINKIELKNNEILKFDDKLITYVYTDYEQPIGLEKYWDDETINTLYINTEWYLKNINLCDELFRYICKNTNSNKLTITNSVLINDSLIDSICENKNLNEITLASYDKNPYSLKYSDYLKFKNSIIKKVKTGKVDNELLENFDQIIDYNRRKLIGNNNYYDLQKKETITIDGELTQEELENFKYLNSNTLIIKKDNYKKLSVIINKVKNIGQNNRIVISFENSKEKEEFIKEYLTSNINYENLFVSISYNDYIPITDFLKAEKKLYKLIEKASNLSPFEKYIYAYNQAKQFKEYKENEENRMEARDIYKILFNEYMVCVGFSNMFGELLDKQGINNMYLSTRIDISYDGISTNQETFVDEKIAEKAGHARRYVYIKDEKYNINGFYIADPTWDNDMEKDLYNHLAMTNEEVTRAKRYLFYNENNSEELFNINSMEEYIQKINFILNRQDLNPIFKTEKTIKNIMKDLINDINKLDSKYIDKLKEKYTFIEDYKWPENVNDLVHELGEYLLNRVNKEIPGQVIMEAVANVYRGTSEYTEEEINNKMIEIINDNKIKQESNFPLRYAIKTDGTKEIIMNETNKFDITYENNKTR